MRKVSAACETARQYLYASVVMSVNRHRLATDALILETFIHEITLYGQTVYTALWFCQVQRIELLVDCIWHRYTYTRIATTVNEWGRTRIPIDSRFIIKRVCLWGKTILDSERSDECNDFTMIYAFDFCSCLKAFFLMKTMFRSSILREVSGSKLDIYIVDNLVGQNLKVDISQYTYLNNFFFF